MNQNIAEANEAAPILCQSTPQVVFHPGVPESSPNVIRYGAGGSTLSSRAEAAHATQAFTETDAPDTATPEAIGSGKINSNHAQPTEGQAAKPSLPANPDSDVTLLASFGGSKSDSEYVE